MELYREGFFPPDNLKRAMCESGVPEEEMWGVRKALIALEQTSPQQPEPKKKHIKKVVLAPSDGPPEIKWHGKMILRGHEVNLAELNQKDHKRAAAHDED